jgi:hypothetical protein
MGKISEKNLRWRRRQARGAIMTPEKFKEIEQKAAASGTDNPSKVAGAAYWASGKKKFRERKKK